MRVSCASVESAFTIPGISDPFVLLSIDTSVCKLRFCAVPSAVECRVDLPMEAVVKHAPLPRPHADRKVRSPAPM